jgi:signal transduction histidine kinase/ligand-binding sensor domain-containing protein
MGWPFLLLLTAAFATFLPARAAEWVTRSWQTEDGLPQDSVNAIVQTNDGFLWAGTSAGLARFDGVRFRTFGLQDGLRSVRITALAEDRQDALWVGTSGGGVSRWNRGRFTSFGAEQGFPQGREVIALAADRDGSMWIGTDKGLVHWSDGTFKLIGEAQNLPEKQVRALLQDSKGTLWVSVILGGLFRGSGGEFKRMEGAGPVGGNVYSLMEDRDGAIWAGNDALWKWSGGEWKQFDSSRGLPKSMIQALAQSADGSLWVGVRSSGLYRFHGEQFLPAEIGAPLSALSVGAVIHDREGSMWVGAVSGGLHRCSPRLLQYWGSEADLGPTAVTSVVEDESGGLIVGTASRGTQRFKDGRFSPLTDPGPSEDHALIYTTTSTSDGAIWVAGEQCLFRFRAGQPMEAFLDKPIRGEAIRALCADGDALWLGTYYSALLRYEAGSVRTVAPGGSFPGTITSLAREAADTLWIGTSAGLHRWESGKVQTWTTRDGLLTDNIRALHRDADGTLWIGTLGGGLTRFKEGRFASVTTRHGLIDDVISQIVPDDFGALWLGCNRGIMRLERQELDAVADGNAAKVHPLIFGRNEGMSKEQCFGGTSPTAFKTRDGRIFFPTMSGLAEIDPRRLQNFATPSPQASIEEILVDQRAHAIDEALVIPPGNHRLEIAYTAPLLRGGGWLRFRHRLEGFDRDWVIAGNTRLATYDRLPPGDYRFRVAAADGQGNWQQPDASLAFSLQPHFWQTLWFRASAGILLIGVSVAVVWWQQRRKHLRHIAELELRRKQQAELAHASRVTLLGELSASIAHELKQPLAAILSNAQAGVRFLGHEPAAVDEMHDILTDIASANRRATEIINRMCAMMKKGQLQIEPRDLNSDVDQVLVLIRGELAAREVTVETILAPDLPLVRGDHIQLQQVVLNLVINGCDAMHGNRPEDRRVVIETAREGSDRIRVSVTDRGAGIAPDKIERIFEPFYSTKSNGLGMGLAICHAIIKAHGGRIWASNNPEGGATFHFTLMQEARGSREPESAEHEPAHSAA